MKYFPVLLIGTEEQGTCTADSFDSVNDAIKAFKDIKKNKRNSNFLEEAKNNPANIDFNGKEEITISIDFEDKESYPVDSHPYEDILTENDCNYSIII